MKIAIDLDKTVFYCNSLAYLIANKFFQNENPRKFKYVYMHNANTKSNGLINKMIEKIIIPCNYSKYKNVEGSVEAIKYLQSQGHELYFISKRPNLEIFNNIVYKWFEENKLPTNKVVLSCSNKVEYCKFFEIDILIDDFEKTCELAKANDINVFQFKTKEKECWNEIVKKIDKINEKRGNNDI